MLALARRPHAPANGTTVERWCCLLIAGRLSLTNAHLTNEYHQNDSCYFAPPQLGVRSIAMRMYACLSVCVYVCPTACMAQKTTGPNFTKFSVHVNCDRGSILL